MAQLARDKTLNSDKRPNGHKLPIRVPVEVDKNDRCGLGTRVSMQDDFVRIMDVFNCTISTPTLY